MRVNLGESRKYYVVVPFVDISKGGVIEVAKEIAEKTGYSCCVMSLPKGKILSSYRGIEFEWSG